MGQTITVILIDPSTLDFHPLIDTTNIISLLTNEQKERFMEKHKTNENSSFTFSIQEIAYEVEITKTPSGDLFAVLKSLQEKSLKSLLELESTMREQQMKLFELAQSRTITKESLRETIEHACQTIAELIQVERVGIWLFDSTKTVLEAENIYDARVPSHYSGDTVDDLHFPTYFEAIQKSRAMAIHDVATDHRVKEMYPQYFQAMGGIQSMLDAPIMMSTGIGGVLCCETLSKRHWTELDQTLVGTLADMVAFLYERIYRIETEERMKHLAYVDQTTGLMNQNGFEQTVASILTNSEDGKFIYLVIDQFVTIQEVLGFDGGDQVLQQIADRLTALFPNPSYVARLAMDHFVLFVPSFLATPIDDLLIQLKKPYIIKGQEIYVSYSYGSATYPIHGSSVKECLQNAQIALSYGKKLSTQSISSLYNPFMKEASQILFDTEFNLRKGLDMQQFSLYYQPQVNARTGEVEGFEALIRWQHPEKGIIPPIDFIQHAESTGLILPIGEWVIDRAFYQLEQWRDQGIDQCSISINVSPRHFLHEKLIPHLELCLLKYNVKSSDVIIEITENVAMGDYLAVQSRIAELHALGFKISIDDFGTGFSAFIYLQHFTIDEIKIDRQFILDIESNKKSLGIVKSILDLANLLDLRVVVEGVETENQLHLLSQLGCETIQGYLYSRPLDTNQLKTWLHERISK